MIDDNDDCNILIAQATGTNTPAYLTTVSAATKKRKFYNVDGRCRRTLTAMTPTWWGPLAAGSGSTGNGWNLSPHMPRYEQLLPLSRLYIGDV